MRRLEVRVMKEKRVHIKIGERPKCCRMIHPHEMLVFDDFLSEISTTAMNVALQLSDFCNFLITFALLGSFLADPEPPEFSNV